MRVIAAVIAVSLVLGCSGNDDEYFPYAMRGLNAYVYDMDADREIFIGFMEGRYWNREQALGQCQMAASSQAAALNLENWDYVCCTVTSDSQCVTKVK